MNNKSVVCAIFDKVASLYSGLLLFTNNECAIRYFNTQVLKDPKNASDYELYNLGNYDCSLGLIEVNEKPVLLKKGLENNVENI